MKKIIFFTFLFCLAFQNYSFSMSDKLYNQCLHQNDFKSADGIMTKNWKKLKSILSEEDFKFVLQDQRRWIKNGREKEIDYIKSDYQNLNLCSLYAVSSYARATLLGEIGNFLENNPNYSQADIDHFIHQLDYVAILNNVAHQIEPSKAITAHTDSNSNPQPKREITDVILDKAIDKAKDMAIEKAVDVGVKWLLKKLIR